MKNLKEALVLGFALMHGVEQAGADDKWEPKDALFFTPVVKAVGPAVEDMTLIPSEIRKASPADWDELLAWAAAEFDLDDDVVEAKVEAALEVVDGLARGWAKWPKTSAA